MNINNNIKKRKLKRNYTKKPKYSKKKSSWGFLRIFIYWVLFFIVLSFLMWLILYAKYIRELPSISELENYDLQESSTIYDREWGELYKFFTEKRTYVNFDRIWENMVNAIVAWEDKRYWENPWIDIIWLARAWIYFITWKSDWKVEWTSTLTQQLIRNTIITNERSVERKIKEIYLAYKLTSWVSKEKILELYLNKISFGHNAYWIEEAAKTYFDKSATELNILESSILASLPKWQTYYSPYNHPDRTLWFLYYFNEENPEEVTRIINNLEKEENEEIVSQFTWIVEKLKWNRIEWTDELVICWANDDIFKTNYNIDSDWCLTLRYSDLLMFLNNIQLSFWEWQKIEYQTWRKDFILWRMLEDGYINFDEYKEAVIDSIGFVFNKNTEEINSPHFVFFIKEYLENKYGNDILSIWWLDIHTSLDPNLQTKAEEIVTNQVAKNTTNYNAKNWALISIDNKNWDILAMVWSVDYFDEENKWQVNVTTSTLQPGSSFKPFVYALAIYNSKIWTKTPVYDLETNFSWDYSPQNFDWEFMWKMNLTTALNYSRNIPAIKMVPLAWWEDNIVNFMKKLWAESLNENVDYWLSIWLWTWEMTPLELATAYSVFANLWEKVEINPILKIVDTKWNIIEEKTEINREKTINEAQSYIITEMLSDTSTRPAWWNNYLSLSNRKVSAKTWTSNKQYLINGRTEIYPWNLWTAWYTPQITTVAWAGNTNWERLKKNWSWLVAAGSMWKEYMEFAHKEKAREDWVRPSSVKELSVSEITWLLPSPDNVGSNILTKSLFVNPPTDYDNSFKKVRVDRLCNWQIWPNTPDSAIKEVTLVEFKSLIPSRKNWEWPVQEWAKSSQAREKYWNIPNLVTSVNEETCERSNISWNLVVSSNIQDNGNFSIWDNYFELAYSSNNPVNLIEIYFGDDLITTIDTQWKTRWSYSWNLFIAAKYRNTTQTVQIKAIDEYYYSDTETKNIIIWATDNDNPIISIENPQNRSITLYEPDFFNIRFDVNDRSRVKTKIFINWVEEYDFWNQRRITQAINDENKLGIWRHLIRIESTDAYWNTSSESIDLEIIPR